MSLPVVAAVMLIVLLLGAWVVQVIAIKPHPTHLVLIVLDTVRRDHLCCYGYPLDTTPALRRFADGAVVFEEARSAAPWTLPSHASLFTGLLPTEHGCDFDHRYLVDRHVTIAEAVGEHGHETFGVTTNVNASSLYHLDQGFDQFLEIWKIRARYPGLSDSSIVNRRIQDWLDRRDERKPFFLFVNYSDAHLPYRPSPEHETRFGSVSDKARRIAGSADLLERLLGGEIRLDASLKSELVALYDAELRTLDDRLGELLDLLEARGLLEHSMIVITSDHGELLGEDGLLDHQLSMREELLRVPLLVQFRHRVRPHRIKTPVSLTSVMQFFTEASRGAVPEWDPPPDRIEPGLLSEYAEPHDLLARLAARGVDVTPFETGQQCAFTYDPALGRCKWLLSDSTERLFLLDLNGEGDDRIGEFPDLADRLRAHFQRVQTGRSFREIDADMVAEGESGEATLAELEAIGYVGQKDLALSVHASEHWSIADRALADLDPDRAVQNLEWALKIRPDHLGLLFAYAECLDRTAHDGKREAWRQYLEAAERVSAVDSEYKRRARERLEKLSATRGE